jgi:hypothetical protein
MARRQQATAIVLNWKKTMAATGDPGQILMPGGKPVGVQGTRSGIRELPGGMASAQEMFDKLLAGGTQHTPPNYPGTRYKLPGGGWVGLRPASKSGPPTIDVNIPGIPIKFKPGTPGPSGGGAGP